MIFSIPGGNPCFFNCGDYNLYQLQNIGSHLNSAWFPSLSTSFGQVALLLGKGNSQNQNEVD